MSTLKDFVRVKSAFLSKGVLGGVAGTALGVSQIAGFLVSPQDVISVQEHLTAIATAVAGLLAIYGRIKASTRVSLFG